MLHGRLLPVFLVALFSLALTASAQEQAADFFSRFAGPQEDGRPIQRLEWTAPAGEQPQTYEEYLAEHPLRPLRVSKPLYESKLPGKSLESLTILVEEALYPQIEPALATYIADLEARGHSVVLLAIDGGTPAGIKSIVQGRYSNGATGMLFIGDIAAAWMEVSGASTPCDLYYMDLDGYWDDINGDGVFDFHVSGSGDQGPEVFVARLYATSLTYDSEANMVNGYLDKAHAYRRGELLQNWGSLEYIEEDWYTMGVALDLTYGNHVERHDGGYHTTSWDYLDKMSVGRHFVQVCVHSFSGGHHFGMRPTEAAGYAHTYVYSPEAQSAILSLGADDSIKAWLNGDNVFTATYRTAWQADQYQPQVDLQQGWNRLLCKISQIDGSYCFSSRLADLSGEPLPGLRYQLDDPQVHGSQPIFVTDWLLNGFHVGELADFSEFLDMDWLGVDEAMLNPQAGDLDGGEAWTVFSAGGSYIDFTQYDTDRYGVMYAFARIIAPEAMTCDLRLGYDDGVRVWLNGEVVLTDQRLGGYLQDMTTVEVNLQPGENRLLLKVSQHRGGHGIGARFAASDGAWLPDLVFDPAPGDSSYHGEWLLTDLFHNDDRNTLLSQDYLGGESLVRPNSDDDDWHALAGSGYPVDLGAHFDGDGGWIFSSTIQQYDPPVLFYNLFACGPGLFTDKDYLAGSYIFNTTWGLMTVASARSGSMLEFDDFTRPLGQGETIGSAFRQWFDEQAPFQQWEREWYYGLILNGDPLLTLEIPGDINGDAGVDQQDLGLLLAAYDSAVGDPAYDEAIDLNGDGVIGQPDLGILLGHYGYTRP